MRTTAWRYQGPAAKVLLPFEGDHALSLILSKAFMLANDKKIKDPAIRSRTMNRSKIDDHL